MMKKKISNFISKNLDIEIVSDNGNNKAEIFSKFFYPLSNFEGILNGEIYHVECRYTNSETMLDLNLVDHIPFNYQGINNLLHEKVLIIYFCDFEWQGQKQLFHTLNDRRLILSTITKEVKHIYLFRNFWKNHISFDSQLAFTFRNLEFETGSKESRFIMGYRSKGKFKKQSPDLPLISIIMPTFNSEKTIEQSLQSVIYQNYSNYELLIIDGISTDRTLEIVKKYEKYIDGVISEKDINIFDAINKGTFLSRGIYSVFLGSDDLLMPYSIEIIALSIINGNKPDFFFGDGVILRKDKRISSINSYIKFPKYDEYNIPHICLYISKKVFEDLHGFDIKYDINSDADFKLRLIKEKRTYFKINKPLGIFRDGGYSSYAKGKAIQMIKVYTKNKAVNYKFFIGLIKYILVTVYKKAISKLNYYKQRLI